MHKTLFYALEMFLGARFVWDSLVLLYVRQGQVLRV